jgi:hypothetical protein
MKVISISRRKFLGNYINTHKRKSLPDLFLGSGILLILVLLSIFTLFGGLLSLLTIACVLEAGFGLGLVLNQYFPFQMPPCISGTITVTPSTKQPMPNAA